MKRVWILMALLLALPVVAQEAFTFSIGPQEAIIQTDESAKLKLRITHEGDTAEPFDLFSSDVQWEIRTAQALIVPPTGLNTTVSLRPLFDKSGVYGITLTLRRLKTGEAQKRTITVELQGGDDPIQTYLPSIKAKTSFERGVNPANPAQVTVEVESRNQVPIPQLVIKTRSHTINADHITTLEPGEKKTITFNVRLDSKTSPQDDILRTTVVAVDNSGKSYSFETNPVEFSIVPYGSVEPGIKEEKSFMKTYRTITLSNTGNVGRVEDYEYKVGFFESFFTKSEPKGIRELGSIRFDVPLDVGESRQIIIITNYWSLFVLLVLVLIGIVGYYVFRSPIVLTKTARVVNTKEGGISELKILLSAYNRGKKPIKHIRIIDLVPRIAEYLTKSDPGSIEPYSVVKHEQKGAIIKWKLNQLDPGEERIIVYRIKAKFAIIGGVKLPIGSSRFEHLPGHERTTNSNVAVIAL
ncbi:MAG: hypothetical protein QF486_05540 [Candidatus Woesearchaeota archaeon]|jgi:hypothetical protein|nr:hypothetical protein [Candidatus Woesearchaeota archaeon]MDP7182190.1 hypothetical protein [Candidatus Woesearchaeota archaeon]MDP7199051.1 hypothetical protein [Candidatus Woesearchaeota archaeon]MDP7467761.1 hypothetical protein [Candidatus Woesearchaeota archaeon]MDP7646464.1 hypothetical protein [Candidatus Woesearchaeota archaeon]